MLDQEKNFSLSRAGRGAGIGSAAFAGVALGAATLGLVDSSKLLEMTNFINQHRVDNVNMSEVIAASTILGGAIIDSFRPTSRFITQALDDLTQPYRGGRHTITAFLTGVGSLYGLMFGLPATGRLESIPVGAALGFLGANVLIIGTRHLPEANLAMSDHNDNTSSCLATE